MRNKTVPKMETIERKYEVVPSVESKHFRTKNSCRSDNFCQEPTPKVWHPTLEPYYEGYKDCSMTILNTQRTVLFVYIKSVMSVPINLIS